MITTILLIMIGLKLNILNGWYLVLLITKIFFDGISLILQIIKLSVGKLD